jgi:hypothetical protein
MERGPRVRSGFLAERPLTTGGDRLPDTKEAPSPIPIRRSFYPVPSERGGVEERSKPVSHRATSYLVTSISRTRPYYEADLQPTATARITADRTQNPVPFEEYGFESHLRHSTKVDGGSSYDVCPTLLENHLTTLTGALTGTECRHNTPHHTSGIGLQIRRSQVRVLPSAPHKYPDLQAKRGAEI